MALTDLKNRFKKTPKPESDSEGLSESRRAPKSPKKPKEPKAPKKPKEPRPPKAAREPKVKGAPKLKRPKTAKKQLFKAVKGTKFVLLIGDEGAILVHVKDNVVQSRQFVPDASPENLEELQQKLADDTKAPLVIVIDTMDQSFVQQTLPPVSPLSVNKLIKRRLDRDFGKNDIKGAMVLGREKAGRKDWNFLMVSLEKTPQLSVWLNFALELPNSFKGIYLLSVETEIIVKDLEGAMGVSHEGNPPEWKFFVSHNKVGGFRQVILRNGKLIFTRLAQAIGESTPEVLAGNIEQEMLSTIEYMKRLSFDPTTGLDIIIVASGAIKELIDKTRFTASSLKIFTPYEIAQYFGIEGATQPADQYGDVILAAAIGCSKRHVLPLSTPEAKKFDMLYQISRFQKVAFVLAVLCIFAYALSVTYTIYTTYANIEELNERKAFQQKGLQTLKAEIDSSHLNVEKASDMLFLYGELQKQFISPLPFIERIRTVLRPPIVIKEVQWSLDDKPGVQIALGASAKMTSTITLDFPGVVSPEAFKVVTKKVLADIKGAFQGYDVSYTKLPSRFLETERTDMTFTNEGTDASRADRSGAVDTQLTIKGGAILKPLKPAVAPAGVATPLISAAPVPTPALP